MRERARELVCVREREQRTGWAACEERVRLIAYIGCLARATLLLTASVKRRPACVVCRVVARPESVVASPQPLCHPRITQQRHLIRFANQALDLVSIAVSKSFFLSFFLYLAVYIAIY